MERSFRSRNKREYLKYGDTESGMLQSAGSIPFRLKIIYEEQRDGTDHKGRAFKKSI